MEKISIIVPVYNVQDYLENCVQSLINQTYNNIEILLIDDGSTDKSSEICDTLSKNDNRIIVFHTINKGVSSARNLGLDKASGKYITFVDSDDFAEPNYIEEMVNAMQGNIELVCCDYKMKTDSGTFDINGKNKKDQYIVKNKKDFFQLYQHILTPSVWGKLFIKSKITNQFNSSLSYCEDDLFILDYLKNIENIVFVNKCIYIYRNENRETLSRKAYKNLLESFQSLQTQRENAIRQICDSKLALSALAMSNVRQLTIILEINIKTNHSYKFYKQEFFKLKKNEYFKSLLKTSKPRNLKERILLLVFKMGLSRVLYSILKRR